MERLLFRNFNSEDRRNLSEMTLQHESSEQAAYDHEWPTSAEELKGIANWFAEGG